MNDQQVIELKEKRMEEHEGNANLGKIFLLIGGVVAAILMLTLIAP